VSNAVYPKAKETALTYLLSLGVLKAVLVDTTAYTYSSAHQYMSSVPSGARVVTPITLSSVTNSSGVLNAANLSWTGLSGVPAVGAVLLYLDTGSDATSPVLAYIDTASGLPTSANPTRVDVQWDIGANKILAL